MLGRRTPLLPLLLMLGRFGPPPTEGRFNPPRLLLLPPALPIPLKELANPDASASRRAAASLACNAACLAARRASALREGRREG